MLLKRILVIIAILSLLIPGCGEDNETLPQNHAYPKLQLVFSPALRQQVEITRVVIFVTAPDIEPLEFRLKVEGRRATGTIAVPVGRKRKFTIEAYAVDEIIYEGEITIESLELGIDFPLELRLERVKLTLEIVPSEIEVSRGDTFEVRVRVKHVKELFGYTFELEYDENLLKPVIAEMAPEDFLGDDILFLFQVGQDRLSVGVTRRAGAESINGSWVIARVKFQALASGTTVVKIAQNDALALLKEDGTNVDRFGEIVLKDLKVIIK